MRRSRPGASCHANLLQFHCAPTSPWLPWPHARARTIWPERFDADGNVGGADEHGPGIREPRTCRWHVRSVQRAPACLRGQANFLENTRLSTTTSSPAPASSWKRSFGAGTNRGPSCRRKDSIASGSSSSTPSAQVATPSPSRQTRDEKRGMSLKSSIQASRLDGLKSLRSGHLWSRRTRGAVVCAWSGLGQDKGLGHDKSQPTNHMVSSLTAPHAEALEESATPCRLPRSCPCGQPSRVWVWGCGGAFRYWRGLVWERVSGFRF